MAGRRERPQAALELCLALIRLAGRLVPAPLRPRWAQEWEAEVRHHWTGLEKTSGLNWRSKLALVRRVLGALPDAAWLRRQFTADADLVHDLRHGLRLLRRDLGFASTATAILALGIGSAGAIFTVADALLLRPLPYPEPEHLVTLWQTGPRGLVEREEVAPANFLDWRERARSFSGIAAAVPHSYDYTGGDHPEVLFAVRVTEGFLGTMGVVPFLGRDFRLEEHQAGRDRVALLGHGLWQRRFGSDPGLVGRTVPLDGEPYLVVGILPPEFDPGLLPTSGERGVWTPHVVEEHDRFVRGSAWWNVVARLKPGVSLDAARAEMAAVASALSSEHPRTNKGSGVVVLPFHEHLTAAVRPALKLLIGAVALLLLVTWANVAGLLLARGGERERELAIRSSLGAARGRLVRQLLGENALLAALGCAFGLLLARWGVDALVALAPADLPRMGDVRLDGRAVAFAGLVTVATTLACGIMPALRLSHVRAEGALRDGGRAFTGSRRRQRLRQGLVVAEVAVALVLLAGAGLLTRSFSHLTRVDPGFRPDSVVALQVFAWDRHPTADRLAAFFQETLSRLASLPGVTASGVVSRMPFIEASINVRSPLAVEGRPVAPGDEDTTYLTVATRGYFEAMGIPLRSGRFFDDGDRRSGRLVAVVNETLAHRLAAPDPLGLRLALRWQGRPIVAEVVGVAAAVRHERLDQPADPEVFLSHAQVPFGSMTYVLRVQGDPAFVVGAARERVWSVDPLQSFYRTATVTELVARSLAPRRFLLLVLGAFAAMALLLTVVGVYGLVRFVAAQRSPEIGVRIALGAGAGDILRLVLAEGMGLVLLGIGLGLGGALALAGSVRGLLYGVSASDPATLGGVSLLLASLALLACYLPAYRAMRVDPVAALRDP